MRISMGLPVTCLGLWLALACSSERIDDDADAGASSSGGAAGGPSKTGGSSGKAGSGGVPMIMSECSGALRQSLALLDQVSTGAVKVLASAGSELTLYVDASAGGVDGQDKYPWVYVSLATGSAVALDDLGALESTAWDLALKRSVLRTNGGDSGPGQGGALRVGLAWDAVDASTLGERMVPSEDWFNEDCELNKDATGNVVTTFADWGVYDPALHTLTPDDAVYLVHGADGALYKVAIVDYYSTPAGAHGAMSLGGHYKLRVAPLP